MRADAERNDRQAAPAQDKHPPGPIPTAPAPGQSAFYSRLGLLEAPRL